MDLFVHLTRDGWRARFDGLERRCAVGRGGVRADKKEGDGATPAGSWPVRRLLYRADRLPPPPTALPSEPVGAADGWCDDPGDRRYNRPVRLPYPGRHERLWREDEVYDCIMILGYNDDAPVPDRDTLANIRSDLTMAINDATDHGRALFCPSANARSLYT